MKIKDFTQILIISLAAGLFFFSFFVGDKSVSAFIATVGISLFYTVILGLGNQQINGFLNRRFSWVDNTTQRAVFGIIATIIANVLMVYICNYIVFVLIKKQDIDQFFSPAMNFVNWFTINFSLLISAVLHAKSFISEWKRSTRREVVEQKLIARSANAQFETLKNQLDPHFLFNSLNVLSALIDENPEQAQHFTASMSKIYRYILEQKDKELVTVKEEIEFAKTYCELLETRFEDSVKFSFDVGEDVLQLNVVPLSLQLLLENCIKHNHATSQKPLHIKIYSEPGYLLINNNLQSREQVKESSGIGLSNIVQRYALITTQNVYIEKSADFFRVKIPLLNQKPRVMNTPVSKESLAYQRASKRVKELQGFYRNLISYCVVIPFLIFINLTTAPSYHWFWWPMLGWGIGLASHAIQVFGIGGDWEEKQIRKMMERDNKN